MSLKKTQSIDMIHGPLLKNIWIYSVPLMATNFLQMLFNAADTVVVGRFAGEQALAAVGATGSLCFLLISLFNGLSMGSNVLIARYIGAQDHDKIEKAVHTSITLAAVSGILLTGIGYFLSRPLLEMMSTPSDIIGLSELYMRIYFVGTFFGLIYNFGASILRAKGDTKRPLYFLCISGITNVVLNMIFVVFFHMSVAGVAIATVISQAVSTVMVCKTLMEEKDATRLDFKKLGIDLSMVWNIVKIGVPAGIQGMVFSLSNVVVQSSINSFDSSTIVAGNSAGANVENFVYIGMMAFTQACITFTSQNIGAKNYGRVKEIFKTTMILDMIAALSMGFIVWYFGDFFLGFYTSEPAVVEAGMSRLFWVALFLVLNGILDVFVCSMRGMGYSTLPTAVMIVGICGVRLTWLWTVFPMHRTLDVIYMCFPISWTITSIIQGFFWVYCHNKLLKNAELVQE
ncbi:MAG: MATE family efflux transporter [Erysipelotrichaceae bacterium]|nr:MATE family efflux transporter [Erysipelotrichaceae bacterium]